MFEIYKDKDGFIRFRVKGTNGRIMIASAQKYKTINEVKDIISYDLMKVKFSVEIRRDKNGNPYVRIVGEDNNLLGFSESYSTKSNANRGAKRIVDTITNFRTKIVDNTAELKGMQPLLTDYSFSEK